MFFSPLGQARPKIDLAPLEADARGAGQRKHHAHLRVPMLRLRAAVRGAGLQLLSGPGLPGLRERQMLQAALELPPRAWRRLLGEPVDGPLRLQALLLQLLRLLRRLLLRRLWLQISATS
jgi:hypothetical protein